MKRDNPYWLLDCARKPKGVPTCTPQNLREFIDFDYLHILTKEELTWLQEFVDAYYNGKKNEISEGWSPTEFKESFQRNNARRRDILVANRNNRCSFKKEWEKK